MRDIKRIDRIINLLHKRWKENPDLRLCQLVSVFALNSGWKNSDIFHLEDDKIEKALRDR